MMNVTDSLSYLNTTEHFGLGRYGDALDPKSYIAGFKRLIEMLQPDGILYISFPFGKATRCISMHTECSPLKTFFCGFRTHCSFFPSTLLTTTENYISILIF